jgi:hypothetical protein
LLEDTHPLWEGQRACLVDRTARGSRSFVLEFGEGPERQRTTNSNDAERARNGHGEF